VAFLTIPQPAFAFDNPLNPSLYKIMSLTGEEKIEIATSRKEAGDEAFKKGDLQTGELLTPPTRRIRMLIFCCFQLSETIMK